MSAAAPKVITIRHLRSSTPISADAATVHRANDNHTGRPASGAGRLSSHGARAGQIRTVAIAKGAMFCLPQYIESSAAIIFRELHDEDCLRGLRHDMFVERLAYYLGEVNALHPFREGNGGRSGPSSRSSPATLGSRSPGSTLMRPATSRPPSRSCAAIPNRCGRCSKRSPGTAPDHTRSICIRNGARVWGGRGAPEWPFWSGLRAVAGLAPAGARQPLRRGEAGGAWHPVDAAGWLVTGPDPLAPPRLASSRRKPLRRRAAVAVPGRRSRRGPGRPWVRAGGRSCRGCRQRPSR